MTLNTQLKTEKCYHTQRRPSYEDKPRDCQTINAELDQVSRGTNKSHDNIYLLTLATEEQKFMTQRASVLHAEIAFRHCVENFKRMENEISVMEISERKYWRMKESIGE